VINYKCRVVYNYSFWYLHINRIKYGRTTNFTVKYINKEMASRSLCLE
jgi:hypothetical protein